jgi:hypothetical protein
MVAQPTATKAREGKINWLKPQIEYDLNLNQQGNIRLKSRQLQNYWRTPFILTSKVTFSTDNTSSHLSPRHRLRSCDLCVISYWPLNLRTHLLAVVSMDLSIASASSNNRNGSQVGKIGLAS